MINLPYRILPNGLHIQLLILIFVFFLQFLPKRFRGQVLGRSRSVLESHHLLPLGSEIVASNCLGFEHAVQVVSSLAHVDINGLLVFSCF